MINQPDSQGRYPLSGREYGALKTIFGAINALDTDALDTRCKLTDTAYSDIHTAHELLRKAMDAILETIPVKKLAVIRRELKTTYCILKTNPVAGNPQDHMVYVDQPALIRLMERAIHMDCCLCEKSARECRRCQLYKDLNSCFPFELTQPEDALCPFAGMSDLVSED